MTQTIATAVGLNSANRSSDVLTVQTLLNGVPASLGGSATPLALDGIFGDNTAQAISAFQMKQFGWADCVVSPGQVTLQRLNALSQHADANVAQMVKTVVTCIGYLGQIPGVYASFGAQYVLLNDLSARLEPATVSASGTTIDVRAASVGGALPIFGVSIPWPFPVPAGGGGAAAGVGPQGLIFLALALLAYIIANRPVAIPQTDADKVLQRDLDELEKLTIMLSVAQAKQLQQQVKAQVKSIEDCIKQRLDHIFKCSALIELFKTVSADVLRKLQTYITSITTFPGLLKALNDALNNYNALLKSLRECLECDKLDKQGIFFSPRSRVAMRGLMGTARGSAITERPGCGLMRDCPSCAQGYLAFGLQRSEPVHQPP
jgi:peptidoglycan hydrolase-like protein with peptidoglycan-binding domain